VATQKLLIFLKRRPGMSLEEFREYYETVHMPLCLKYARGVTRYVRRYIEHPVDEATGQRRELDHDVVTEIWFEDSAIADAALKYAGHGILPKAVIADEERLFDRSKNRMVRVTEYETDLSRSENAG
jgi:hypothetical protein